MLRRNDFEFSYVDNGSLRLLDFYADSWRHPKLLPRGWALELEARTASGEAVPNRNSATATVSPGHQAHVNHAHLPNAQRQMHSDKCTATNSSANVEKNGCCSRAHQLFRPIADSALTIQSFGSGARIYALTFRGAPGSEARVNRPATEVA